MPRARSSPDSVDPNEPSANLDIPHGPIGNLLRREAVAHHPDVVWISNEGPGVIDGLATDLRPPPNVASAAFFITARNGTEPQGCGRGRIMSMTDQNLPAMPANALPDEAAMKDWAELLVQRARAEGVELTGDGGLLTGLVRQVLQTGLEVEMTDHLGYERHAVEGRGSGNSRNGTTPKRVTTEVGQVDLQVPRDREGRIPHTGRQENLR